MQAGSGPKVYDDDDGDDDLHHEQGPGDAEADFSQTYRSCPVSSADDDINRQEKFNTNGPETQGPSVAEQLKNAWHQAPPFPITEHPLDWKAAVWLAYECKTQLEAALVYAKYGIPVFPCGVWEQQKLVSKKPIPEIGKGGLYRATTDPAQIEKWWKRFPDALIGVPMGRRVGIWTLDVDAPMAHSGNGLSAWGELEARNGSAGTRTHLTGSNGLHLLYSWNSNRPVGCPTSTVPKGMEVKGDGGYVIFPPSPYERDGQMVRYSVSNDEVPEQAPKWLYDLILGPRQKGNGSAGEGHWTWSDGFGPKKLEEICELVRSATIHHWDEACIQVFLLGRWAGGGALDVDEALDALDEAARQCRAPVDYPKNVKRAFENGVRQPLGPFFSEDVLLTDFYSYMPLHNYINLHTREHWPASSVNARIRSVDKGIKASAWIDQHRPVDQMTWAPGEKMLIEGRFISEGGWIKKNGWNCFNLYRPPTIEPGDASKVGPWLDHLHKVWNAEDAEHIIKWNAYRVQHPEVKINHALVLGSEKHGVGKDAALEPVKRAVGPWNFGEVGPQQLLGRFNGFLKKVILRVSEVRDLGDINRYQFYEHTKAITASPPDVLRVDEKHIQEYSILNCVGIILTTNYKTTGIYLPAEDRRHYVAWSNAAPEDFEQGYWNRLFGWYDAGGDKHVAAYLAGYDLVGFDPKAPPPKTPAFWDIVDANQSPIGGELSEVLEQLGNPIVVTLEQVINKAELWFSTWLEDAKNQRAIPQRFEQCGYEKVRNPDSKQGLWKINNKKQMVYALRELSLKDKLDAVSKLIANYRK
jgi:hypothetical protein